MKRINGYLFEWMFWIVALFLLATADASAPHFSLCPLANMGIRWCPGCGIGHAISAVLKGHFAESIQAHWFGIPATLLLIHRVVVLFLKMLNIHRFKLSGGNEYV